jgi:hypothetical protein
MRGQRRGALSVNGCRMLALPANTCGDALVFLLGTRWRPALAGRWSPYAHFLVDALKLTKDQLDPAKKRVALEANKDFDLSMELNASPPLQHPRRIEHPTASRCTREGAADRDVVTAFS